MDYKAIFRVCRDLGCCDACCVRYCALRKPTIFGDTRQFIKENIESDSVEPKETENPDAGETEGTPAKRTKKGDVCVSCLGILQEDGWPECLAMSKEVMDNKKYETSTFACALSAPLATIIREKVVLLKLSEKFPTFDSDAVTPLKEAWKWSLGARLAAHLGLTLDSGACAPLMLTLSMEYEDDSLEAEVFAPSGAQLQRRPRRQRAAAPVTPVTRCLLDRALDGITLSSLLSLLSWTDGPARARGSARCVAAHAHHAPLYLAGRYIKLSRSLPQSPWRVRGERVLPSSVQEVIFQPIADLYRFTPEEAEHRLKFQSAGREDVDVRCLGDGRPFAIEIADPRRALTADELARACDLICRSGTVWVHKLIPIHKDKLAELKAGEESKLKTYEALCIKLTHSPEDRAEGATESTPVGVSARDLTRALGSRATTGVLQRTPLRVLHRRALAERARAVTVLHAEAVPGHPALFIVRVRTPAGTYVKEWAHGEAGRTRPALAHALCARADILALDVTQVQLAWP